MCATTQGTGIGQRVRSARARLGLSREALAVESGISWAAITQIESGRRRNVRPDTLAALSAALGVTVDYLVHGGASLVMLQHQALLHETDEEFMRTIGRFVSDGIELSEPTLVVTTPAKAALVRKQIGTAARNVDFRDSARVFAEPSAFRHTFRTFVTDSLEHGAAWVRIVGEAPWMKKTAAEARRVH
ncbi:MAG: helix-turn-helix domain-containing protein [Chloroflexota bacterium]|nr:helix-turn-helix domain-containing protein [Chloroflexota bacterium]